MDLSAEKVTGTLNQESGVDTLQYENEDTVLGITMSGDLFAIHPKTGGIETGSQAMFAQYGGMQHWMIGKDQILAGALSVFKGGGAEACRL